MGVLLKLFFSITTLALCLYGMRVFGVGLWSTLFALGGGFIFLSLFLPVLDPVVMVLAGVMGALSLLGLGLLLLAATTGGSFHLAPGDQIFALGLGLLGLSGCGLFLVIFFRR